MKTILITGATSGIGMATARQLADQGFRLILCGRRQNILDEFSQELSKKTEVFTLKFDVRFQDEVEKALDSLPNDWKNIDVLVNNAGNAHGLGHISNGEVEDWDKMIDGNVKGLLYVSRKIIPWMKERNTGHIINISSIAGKETYANGVVYCASKHAVEAVSQGMRLELTEFGIKITNVSPGAVETDFSLVRFRGDKERAEKVYQGYEALKAEDIADVIWYAINAPKHVTIADVTVLPSAQSEARTIYRK